MSVSDSKFKEYLKNSLAQGRSKEDIYKELLGQGWTIEFIQKSFDSISTEREEDADTAKKTIRIIVTIGAVLIGAGIFSLIATNWLWMSKPIKITIILISMIISYSVGWYLKEKSELQETGGALILLGSIIYGAGIFLVAQMFNVQSYWPDGFILWMIGTIAMAFAIQSYSLFYLAIPLGIVALISLPFGIFFNFGYNQFLFTSSFLLLIATIVTFSTGWIVRKKIPPELKEFY